MGKFLRLSNGVARSFEEAAGTPAYNEVIDVASDISAGTPVTLPNSGTYEDKEILIFVNGKYIQLGEGWNLVGVAPRTQVSFSDDILTGDLISFYIN